MEFNNDFLKKKIRNKELKMRVTEEEHKQINEIALSKGMTISDYLRHCILLERKQIKENKNIEK